MPKLYKGTREILSLADGVANVKALYAGTNLIYGVEDRPKIGSVTLNGVEYRTVELGGLVWLQENYRASVFTYVDKTNSDGLTTRFYKPTTIKLAYTIDGWRIPSASDFEKLMPTQTNYTLGDKKSFNIEQTGRYDFTGSGTYEDDYKLVYFGSKEAISGSIHKCYTIGYKYYSDDNKLTDCHTDFGVVLRLCKDL